MQHAQYTPFSQAQADQLHPGQQQAQVHSVAEPFTVASREAGTVATNVNNTASKSNTTTN